MKNPVEEFHIWDYRMMRLAFEARSWVKGPDLGVGAVVAAPDNRGVSPGYSGLPRGVEDTDERITDPAFKDLCLVHAELNAIFNNPSLTQGGTLYATTAPCAQCCAAAIQTGIARVVSPAPDPESRWFPSQQQGLALLLEAKKEVRHFDMESCNVKRP